MDTLNTQSVFQFYTVEEAEDHLKYKPKDSIFKFLIRIFKYILGKDFEIPPHSTYNPTSEPITYKLIGLEDNEDYQDYCWIVQDDKKNTYYILTNDARFYDYQR